MSLLSFFGIAAFSVVFRSNIETLNVIYVIIQFCFWFNFFLTSYVPDLLYWVRLKMLCCRKMWRKLSFSWSKVYLKMRKADQKKPCHSTQTLWPCVLPQYVLQCRMVFCSVLVFLFIVAMHIFFKKCWVLWTLFRPRIFLMATSRPNYTNWQGKP